MQNILLCLYDFEHSCILSVNTSLLFTEIKHFKILPKKRINLVDEGASFEFRCVYGKGSTEMKWMRQRKTSAIVINDYIPRNLITVLTDHTKSVEVYSIKKVTANDSGTYKCHVTEKGLLRSTYPRVLLVQGMKRVGKIEPAINIHSC